MHRQIDLLRIIQRRVQTDKLDFFIQPQVLKRLRLDLIIQANKEELSPDRLAG